MLSSDVDGRKWGEPELFAYMYKAHLFRKILFVSDRPDSININLRSDAIIWVFNQALWSRTYTLSTLIYLLPLTP